MVICTSRTGSKKKSKDGAKGTTITKNVESLTVVHSKNMIMKNVIQPIKSKFSSTYKKENNLRTTR